MFFRVPPAADCYHFDVVIDENCMMFTKLLIVVVAISSAFPPAMAQAAKGPAAAKPAAPVGSPSPLLKQANSMAFRGKFEAAEALYKKALEAEPKNATVYHMYGRTLALTGNMVDAIALYKQAIELAPTNVELLNDYGVALTANGDTAEAVQQLKKAIAVSPKFVVAHNNLGVSLMQLGDYKGAVSAFQNSLKMQPNNPLIRKKLQQAQARCVPLPQE
jgi:Flp pilus assembly protein TadD